MPKDLSSPAFGIDQAGNGGWVELGGRLWQCFCFCFLLFAFELLHPSLSFDHDADGPRSKKTTVTQSQPRDIQDQWISQIPARRIADPAELKGVSSPLVPLVSTYNTHSCTVTRPFLLHRAPRIAHRGAESLQAKPTPPPPLSCW